MKASELNHRPVVSLNDGVTVGEVADLTLDATHVKVSTLVLVGHNGNSVVPFAAVRHIGTDAVTIDDSRIVQAPADKNEITERGMRTLTGLSVMNQGGAIIGSVDDVEFDEENGQITALLVHRGGVLGIGGARAAVPASAIRGVGPNLITVDTSTVVVSPVKATQLVPPEPVSPKPPDEQEIRQ
jgi:sporulation protein YlmC with PRC-barrel domain